MSILRDYSIDYKGLGDGSHHYDFVIADGFFEAFDGTDIKGGDLEVGVELARRGSLIVLTVEIKGDVSVECDRCLDDFRLPVEYNGQLTVRIGEVEGAETDSDIMWLPAGEDAIPLTQYIYESVYLSLPYQRVHAEGCDPDMLARFRIVTQEQFEKIAGQQEQINPQWAALEQLRDKLEEEK